MPQERDFELRRYVGQHRGELRARIIRALLGWVACCALCVVFAEPLWRWVQEPLAGAAARTGATIVAASPSVQFSMLYLWSPLLAALFPAVPWVSYQVWAFIAPGLNHRAQAWVLPFLVSTGGVFGAGGAFGYLAVGYLIAFLLGIGQNARVTLSASVANYFELFVSVILGAAIGFEMPVAIFCLTLLGITTPRLLLRHSSYAILGIAILAVVRPSPNPVDIVLFFVPMVLLYFLSVGAAAYWHYVAK